MEHALGSHDGGVSEMDVRRYPVRQPGHEHYRPEILYAGGMKYLYRWGYQVLRVYWFFRRPQTAGVRCLVLSSNQVLLVRHTYGRRYWTLPGGGTKSGETLEETVKREIQEEVGLTVAEPRKVGQFFSRLEFKRDTVHCFIAYAQNMDIIHDSNEIAEARWFSLDELPLARSKIIERVAAMSAGLGGHQGLPCG